MGISPIEYHAWKGERTAQNLRLYVIARSVFRHKIGSFGVIILLVIGFLIVHAFSLITIILMSHEELKASDMNSYLGGGLFVIFSMLLAAIVTSDLISGIWPAVLLCSTSLELSRSGTILQARLPARCW